MDRKLTQSQTAKSGKNSSRPSAPSEQGVLPLVNSSHHKQPKSKIIFQLKSELNRLQQRDREWKVMFNMLSHDLKEPLVTLEGFTKLLKASNITNKDQKRYLQVISEAVNSLHTLVGSLQSIARLYQETHELSNVSLKELISSVTTTLSGQLRRTKGQVISPKEDVVFKGDPVRLYQVFLNLIANSLKYHHNGRLPVVTIRYRKDSQFHRISIQDNGVGIDQKDLDRIFVPFTRLEDVPTDGMGIGLSIVKRIAESFGGRVTVRSKANVGATFTVCLPREGRR